MLTDKSLGYANRPEVPEKHRRYYCSIHKAAEWSIRVLEKQEVSEDETKENGEDDTDEERKEKDKSDEGEPAVRSDEIKMDDSYDEDSLPAYSSCLDD